MGKTREFIISGTEKSNTQQMLMLWTGLNENLYF